MTKFEEKQRRVSSRVIGVVTVGMLPGSRGFKSRDGMGVLITQPS